MHVNGFYLYENIQIIHILYRLSKVLSWNKEIKYTQFKNLTCGFVRFISALHSGIIMNVSIAHKSAAKDPTKL